MRAKRLFALALLFFNASCDKPQKPKRPPPNVKIATLKQSDVPLYIETIGQAIPPVTVNIRPQVNGKLVNAYIQQGAFVKEGQILYTIDPRPYQAILDESIAQLEHDIALMELAEQTVERYKSIVDEEFISVLTYQQYVANAVAAKAQVELDRAAVRAAQINVDFCNIVAPVSGKISYFAVDVGNIMVIDDPTAITVIRPSSPIDVLFSLPQQYFELIRQEQGDAGHWKFVAALPESPQKAFEGTTYFLDNQVDQNTGTILLKGRLSNLEKELWPGEFVNIKVLYKIASKAFVAPPGGILMGRDGPYIYIVDSEGKAAMHSVQVLARTNEYIAFESSTLKEGDKVVVDGQINIAPGVLVQATPDSQ